MRPKTCPVFGRTELAGRGLATLRDAANELLRLLGVQAEPRPRASTEGAERRPAGGAGGAPAARGRAAGPVARDPTEALVLDLIERGDHRRALTLLMQTHGDVVYEFCLRFVKDAALADDLRQKVFLQAYEGLPGFAGGSSLRTWLLGIAKYRSLDALRSVQRQTARAALGGEGLLDVVDGMPDPGEQADQSRLTSALLDCLESCLSREERQLILLHLYEGLSYEELAARFGQKADTLRACVARSFPKLRRGLERQGFEP